MAAHPPQLPPEPAAPVQNAEFTQRYLYAFATQGEIQNHVRTQTVEAESARLPEIMTQWTAQQPAVQALMQAEATLANQAQILPIPPGHEAALEAISNDALFKKTFSMLQRAFAMVDIDMLVAPQRAVNVDYVEKLRNKYQGGTDLAHLIDVCLSPTREMPPIRHLEILNNTHVFSSDNLDIRFLGAFYKKLTADDSQYAALGGLPSAAIISFVGYGGNPVNVFHFQNRLVLNNGFHRVYALRSLGVERVPVVVQLINNFQLEFPSQVAGLPREYLIGAARPVLMKDFFHDGFCIMLKAKKRMRTVTLQTGVSQFDVPQ